MTLLGFQVTVSDATGGIVSATRPRSIRQNWDFTKCRFGYESIAVTSGNSTVSASVSARSLVKDSSDIIARVSVAASVPALLTSGMVTAVDDYCVSNGNLERTLRDSLALRRP